MALADSEIFYSYPNEDTFRICYEVAEHQDLFNIVEWYRYNSLVLPESFIWHTFHSLANAFLYCYNGRAESSRAIGWEEMVCKATCEVIAFFYSSADFTLC